MGPRDIVVNFLRISAKIDVTNPLKRGTYLQLRDGSRRWIPFTYERMPMFCYICGMVGHMEKRCPTRYADEFVDLGLDFPYGEWMKATPVGDNSGRIRLPLQPIPLPAASQYSPPPRGISVFGPGSQTVGGLVRGRENTERAASGVLRVRENGVRVGSGLLNRASDST